MENVKAQDDRERRRIEYVGVAGAQNVFTDNGGHRRDRHHIPGLLRTQHHAHNQGREQRAARKLPDLFSQPQDRDIDNSRRGQCREKTRQHVAKTLAGRRDHRQQHQNQCQQALGCLEKLPRSTPHASDLASHIARDPE